MFDVSNENNAYKIITWCEIHNILQIKVNYNELNMWKM